MRLAQRYALSLSKLGEPPMKTNENIPVCLVCTYFSTIIGTAFFYVCLFYLGYIFVRNIGDSFDSILRRSLSACGALLFCHATHSSGAGCLPCDSQALGRAAHELAASSGRNLVGVSAHCLLRAKWQIQAFSRKKKRIEEIARDTSNSNVDSKINVGEIPSKFGSRSPRPKSPSSLADRRP